MRMHAVHVSSLEVHSGRRRSLGETGGNPSSLQGAGSQPQAEGKRGAQGELPRFQRRPPAAALLRRTSSCSSTPPAAP